MSFPRLPALYRLPEISKLSFSSWPKPRLPAGSCPRSRFVGQRAGQPLGLRPRIFRVRRETPKANPSFKKPRTGRSSSQQHRPTFSDRKGMKSVKCTHSRWVGTPPLHRLEQSVQKPNFVLRDLIVQQSPVSVSTGSAAADGRLEPRCNIKSSVSSAIFVASRALQLDCSLFQLRLTQQTAARIGVAATFLPPMECKNGAATAKPPESVSTGRPRVLEEFCPANKRK